MSLTTTSWTRMDAGALPRDGMSPGPRSKGLDRGESGLPYRVLWEGALCVLPAMAALVLVRPMAATYWFFGSLLVVLGINFARGLALTNLALVIATLPAAQALRGYFMYNSVLLLLAGAVGVVLLRSTRYAAVVQRAGLQWALMVACVYWLISFMLSGDYWSNLRVLELMGSATAIVLLAQHRRFLATALLGTFVSLGGMGLALLQFGPRLGMVRGEAMSLGNPITFGIPLALLLLLLVADGGKLLLLRGRPSLRLILIVCVGALLVLSTSRGSWLVAGGGLFLVLVLNGRHRRGVLIAAGLVVLATAVLMKTGRAPALEAAFGRTFSSERSMLDRTSGRSEQWELFSHAMANEIPVWGYGPGTGQKMYARLSREAPGFDFKVGREFMWHSLYMHVGVEAGLVGWGLLGVLFGALYRSNIRWWRRTGELSPLLGTTGFVLVGVGVIGLDAASGTLLGVGFLSRSMEGERAVPTLRTQAEGAEG